MVVRVKSESVCMTYLKNWKYFVAKKRERYSGIWSLFTKEIKKPRSGGIFSRYILSLKFITFLFMTQFRYLILWKIRAFQIGLNFSSQSSSHDSNSCCSSWRELKCCSFEWHSVLWNQRSCAQRTFIKRTFIKVCYGCATWTVPLSKTPWRYMFAFILQLLFC
jgi:hypothetical protein